MQHQTPSTLDQNKLKKTRKIKPIHFFIGFIIFSFISAFIIGGFFIGKNDNKNQQNISDETKEQININPVEFPGNPDNWTIYKFDPINLEFKLPDELNKKGDWKIMELDGETGKIICFSDQNLNDKNTCSGNLLAIGSASSEYENSESDFINSQGFTVENNTYYLKTSSKNYSLENETYKIFENSNNLEIIKILGSESPTSPNKEILGAVINTKNENYPGIVLKMKIGDGISEYQFDQILESLKFTN